MCPAHERPSPLCAPDMCLLFRTLGPKTNPIALPESPVNHVSSSFETPREEKHMRISVANISKKVSAAEFSATVHAVARQVHQDFAPLWGMDADVRGIAINRNTKPNPELTLSDVILYVGELDDDPQKVADAVGYHDLNHKGIPFGFVFTDVAAKVGDAWSTTLSHEVLELLADPDVNLL